MSGMPFAQSPWTSAFFAVSRSCSGAEKSCRYAGVPARNVYALP